jgi:GDPmannose 4,6-dehydratase
MKDLEKRAFVTGITGQDGSYLCELLLEKGYTVHGLVHRPTSLGEGNIRHLWSDASLAKRLFLHTGAFEDATHLRRIIAKSQPHELYHLAGQSSPRLSLVLPETTVDSIGMGTLRLLEIIRDLPEPPKFLYAASSEIFGSPVHSPQDEATPINPTTPYGAAKAFSHQMCRIYRIAYGIQACSAILYNHESVRRSDNFVTTKIARGAARIKRGSQAKLKLGNIEGRRDWGWAPDYVRGMWQMLQVEPVDDFILATGKVHSVRDLLNVAFGEVGLSWQDWVEYDPDLLTTIEPAHACGNPGKARRILGWENSVPFEEIVCRLVRHELERLG